MLALALALAATALALPAGAEKAAPLAPPPPVRSLASIDLSGVPELFPNASVAGTLGPGAPRYFKVFANRSLVAPETLAVTLEATGSLFGAGDLAVFDPEQMLLDEIFTFNPGDLAVSLTIVPETGYYLIVVAADASFTWAVTVNWTSGGASPTDSDNDLGNATLLVGNAGNNPGAVADWDDLVDFYAIDLNVFPPRADALLINLTSPNIADLDVFIYHIVGGLAVVDGFSNSPFGTEYAAALTPADGRFYVRVMSYTGSSPYNLQWSRLNVSADDNAVPATATPLVPGTTSNNLSRWDMRDLFVATLPANTTVNVSLHTEGFDNASRTPDLQAVFYDANFSRVTWSFSFDPDERINALVPTAGVYYLDIYGADPVYYLSTNLTFAYTMTVSIDPPPALSPPGWNGTGLEDVTQVVDLRTLVSPDPAGEPLSFSVTRVTGPVSAAIDPDGHTLRVTPAADASGAATVEVAAQDRWQRVVVALPFDFAPENDAPRLVLPALPVAFDEDTQATLNVSLAVEDIDGDAWTFVTATVSTPLEVTRAGPLVTVTALANFNGAGTLFLTAQDEFGATAVLAVPVVVRPVNDPPAITNRPGPLRLLEDAAASNATFDFSGVASDADGDPFVFFLLNAGAFTWLFVGTNLTVAPPANFAGSVNMFLAASDGNASSTVGLTLIVDAVNDAPHLADPSGPLLGAENEWFRFQAAADDIDSPRSALTFTFSMDGGPVGTAGPLADYSHLFSFDEGGYHVLRVTVFDEELSTAVDYTVFISETNRPPTASILTPRSASFASGAVVSFTARASDPDGSSVNVTWVVDGTAASNSPSFSLDRMAAGHHTVELLVFDGEFTSSDSAQFDVQGGLPGPDAASTLVALAAAVAVATFAGQHRAKRNPNNAPKNLK